MAAVAVSLRACDVCGIPLGYRETCPAPACPCYGTRAGSDEMELAALAWRARPSVAAARTLSGRDALDHLDRMAALECQRAYGDALAVEIVHRSAP
jgi:hypothetical protein